MRRHEDSIEVSCDREGAPSRFTWRGALWRVLAVENRWNETGSWWTSPLVRAARGEQLPGEQLPHGQLRDGPLGDEHWVQQAGDLLDEMVVWRVEAANGLPGSRGIYELVQAPARGQWRLRGVVD